MRWSCADSRLASCFTIEQNQAPNRETSIQSDYISVTQALLSQGKWHITVYTYSTDSQTKSQRIAQSRRSPLESFSPKVQPILRLDF